MAYGRRSRDDLAYGEDYYPERWDRDRFERARRGGGPPSSRESFRYEEDDRYGPRGGYRRDVEIDDRYSRPGPRGTTYTERDRYQEEDRYGPSRQRPPSYFEEDRQYTSNRQVAPYRPRYQEDYEYSRRPGPPLRRQSSWDEHDRPPPNRGYRDDEENVNVTVNLKGAQSGGPPPPQPREEYDRYDRYEHYDRPDPYHRYRDSYRDPYRDSYRESWRESDYYDDEDYRDFSIRRERERSTFRRNNDYNSRRGEEFESKTTYEVDEYDQAPRKTSRRGKTRMPKRLVHRSAIVDFGYPFEEEENFYIVRIALNKDEIDEVIKVSESYFREDKRSTQVSETKMLEAPPAPSQPPQTETYTEKVTTRVIENPTEEEIEKYTSRGANEGTNEEEDEHFSEHESYHNDGRSSSYTKTESKHESQHESQNGESNSSSETEHASVHESSHARSKSKSSHGRSLSRHTTQTRARSTNESRRTSTAIEVEERKPRSNNLEIVVPMRSKSSRRDERDIKAEIRALEAEKRAIRTERDDADDVEIVDRRDWDRNRDTRDVVWVDSDKRSKSKSRSRRPSNKLAEAALFTLT